MPSKQASEIERLFSPCSAIGFRVPQDYKEQLPTIILGFDDEASGPPAYHALMKWAKNDELMIALNNRKDYIDATLIHTGIYETVIVSQLAFSEEEFFNFVNRVPQDRRLNLSQCVNPVENSAIIKDARSLLVLFRYIITIPDAL